jgi:uncharacterized protein
MKRARALYQLQTVETDIDQKSRRLKEVEASLGESEALREARSAVEKAEKQLKESKAKVQRLESDHQHLQSETAAEEDRLYSGRITSPKELSSIQDKIKNLKQRRAKTEDDLLQAMVANEEAEAALAAGREHLERAEADWRSGQSNLIVERDRLEHEVSRAGADRETLRAAISPADVAVYENLRRRKAGQGVVKIVDGACRGCGVNVPMRQAQAVYDGVELIFCGHCERILYGER